MIEYYWYLCYSGQSNKYNVVAQAHLYTHCEGPLYRCRWNNCGRRFSDLGNRLSKWSELCILDL